MIGVEAAYGFGDGLFLVPVIRKIAENHGEPVEVAVQAQCADAFYNLPWVSNIIHINNLHDGMARFKKYKYSYQITPNVYFPGFKAENANHSLIDTAAEIARRLGIGEIDQRPVFIPTSQELDVKIGGHKPRIAVECHYKSGQSWANKYSFDLIIEKYVNTHEILWLSNQDARSYTHPLTHLTRRQIIPLLSTCEIFFSVGSGFFCASLALEVPPQRIVCLWIDEFYRYEQRLAELGWHKNIVWVHNMEELRGAL